MKCIKGWGNSYYVSLKNNTKQHLREEFLKYCSVVICFFSGRSIFWVDKVSIHQHRISHLIGTKKRYLALIPWAKYIWICQHHCYNGEKDWDKAYLFLSVILQTVNPTVSNTVTELFFLPVQYVLERRMGLCIFNILPWVKNT